MNSCRNLVPTFSRLSAARRLYDLTNYRSFGRVKTNTKAHYNKPAATGRTKPLSGAELIDSLDSATQTQGGISKKDRTKLNKSLLVEDEGGIHPATIGHMETVAANLLEHLSEAFISRKMKRVFAGIKNIEDCITSEIADNFAIFMSKKKNAESGAKVLKEMNENITAKLQSTEGFFRSHIIKKVDFRKVPKLFFRPYSEYTKKKKMRTDENNVRMEFLRAEGRHSTSDVDDNEVDKVVEEVVTV